MFWTALAEVCEIHTHSPFPFFFLTMTTLANHSGYCTGLITLTSNSLFTSALAASTRSVDIFLSFCLLGYDPWATFKLCCANSWLTPCKSLADQAKMLLLSWRKSKSRSLSSWVRSVPMCTHLSGASLDNGVFFMSLAAYALGLALLSLFSLLLVGFFATSLMRL